MMSYGLEKSDFTVEEVTAVVGLYRTHTHCLFLAYRSRYEYCSSMGIRLLLLFYG